MAHIEMSHNEFVSYAKSQGINIEKITRSKVLLSYEIENVILDTLIDSRGVLQGKKLDGSTKIAKNLMVLQKLNYHCLMGLCVN